MTNSEPEIELYVFPASFAQQRLWFLDQLEPGQVTYNIPALIHMRGNLHVDALECALQEIVDRHETLRTTFEIEDEMPVQVIASARKQELVVVDLRDLPTAERERRAQELAAQEARTPFDLATGPLLRTTLLVLDETTFDLLITMHHIVSDGWSNGVFIRELSALYEAFLKGLPSPLEELPLQYVDYALNHEELLQGEEMETQLSYWKQKLAGGLEPLQLPTDHPRPPKQTYNGAKLHFTVPHELKESLQELGKRVGTTSFMTLLAAYQVLLHRYSGQDDIIVGSPISGRTLANVEGVIGFFVNSLVLRTQFADEQTFLEVLKSVRQTALEAYANQEVPFEKLVEEFQPDRNMSVSPIFQVMFTLEQEPILKLQWTGLDLQIEELERGTSKFDLLLTMVEQRDRLTGYFEYNTDLFEESTMQRMANHFVKLLTEIVACPDAQVDRIPLLSDAEREQLIEGHNRTQTDYPRDASLAELFEAQVARTPERIAVEFADETLTYAQLNARANQLARHLLKLGAENGALIGISTDRSAQMVVGILAILKVGGAYVPLDPAYPTERLGFMVEDSRVTLLLAQEHLAERFADVPVRLVKLDGEEKSYACESTDNLPLCSTGDSLAYVIYTSGSTGKPKGVLVPQRGVVRLVKNTNFCPFEEYERYAQISNISFDAATFEIWGALLSGGCLVGISKEIALSPTDFAHAFKQLGITTAFLTVSLFNQMASLVPDAFAQMKHLLVGGEALEVRWVREVLKHGAPARLLNGYGPTESTTFAAWYDAVGLAADAVSVPIGRPLSNTQLYVLDQQLQPVPPLVSGELYIGGDGLAVGYLNQPELTKERFIPHPFSEQAGDRLYKTGDLVRMLPDGTIEYIARIDQQVKIRGFRIELGEIEALLAQHPSVRELTVIAREDTPGDKRLVAYLVTKEPTPSVAELRALLKEQLPDYMVPSAYVFLEALPLTANGKLDRRALPMPDRTGSADADSYVAPRTETETIIAGMWADVLGLEQVGIHDPFFAIGGHSLLATRIITRINAHFQTQLPLRSLFEAPTVAEFTELLESTARGGDAAQQGMQIVPIARDQALPLSFAQQRLWFIDHLEPGRATYNISGSFRLQGELNVAVLERSLNEIVRRHESLRTTFATQGEEAVQVIHDELLLNVPTVDLCDVPEEEREMRAHDLATEEANRPFDLRTGPLLRITMLRMSDTDALLVFVMHHIIGDGWSLGVFIRELTSLYTAFLAGQASPLPEPVIQYADYAHWQREWMQGEVQEQQLAYWREQLRGELPILQMPTDFPRPHVPSYRGRELPVRIPKHVNARLQQLGEQQGATLFMTLLGAFQTLLYRYTGQDDLTVGTPIAGRNHSGTEELIGLFVNTLVMRGDLSGAPSFRELLGRVRQTALDAYAHQDVPFEKLVEELQPERNASISPLFQAMFALQNALTERVELPGLTMQPLKTEDTSAKFDLLMHLTETEEGLEGTLQYSTDLFTSATMERLVGHWQTLLASIADDPEQSITALDLLPAEEKHRLLVEWNENQSSYPRAASIVQLFEEQVVHTPENVAVVFGEEMLTYRELNERANQLARTLQRLGVNTGSHVGISTERSAQMVVGFLAILKAGGAYVPLDPAYPSDRLAYMVEDAQVQVLLVQSHLEARFAEQDVQFVRLDTDQEQVVQESTENLPLAVTGDDLAYIIYTSGSTGQPKGVLVPHRGVVRLVRDTNYVQLDARDRIAQVSNTSFDAATFELWGALLNGGRLVGISKDIALSALDFAQEIREQGITAMFLTTALFNQMSKVVPNAFAEMRYLLFGGEQADARWIRNVIEHGKPQHMLHVYGPTENTTFSTWHDIQVLDEQAVSAPIGQALANTTLYVLDPHMQPVPIGVTGELYLGGDGLARGYLNQPELTEERFVPHPFATEAGAKLYKTGDLVRYLPDGSLDFVGRIDHQVKIRGFRIELGEIEALLARFPSVRELIVIAREDVQGDKRIVAYLVLENAQPTVAELRTYLKQQLPEYMVPSAFVFLEQLPLTANGKVDRRALPIPDGSQQAEQDVVAPRTPVEEIVVGIWSDVLHLERISVTDSFFDLGGHSLLAMQVYNRLTDALGVQVELKDLFAYPSAEALAAHLERLLRDGAKRAEVVIPKAAAQDTYELSRSQKRLWFLHQFDPNSSVYHVPGNVQINEAVDVQVFERAVQAIVQRHDALRTVFVAVDGTPRQLVKADSDVGVRFYDVSEQTPDARNEYVRAEIAASNSVPFDLEKGPLMRVLMFKHAECEYQLYLNMHHIITDGFSMEVFVQELATLYGAYKRGAESPLVPLTLQYADYAEWQAHDLANGGLAVEEAFWLERLAKPLPTLELPIDFPRPEVQTFNGDVVVTPLTSELVQQLQALTKKEDVSLFMLLLSAYVMMLHALTGEEDIIVGTPVAGRTVKALEPLIGFFVNTIAIRTRVEEAQTLQELLREVKRQCLDAYQHQAYPFDLLIEKLNPERDTSRSPIFSTMFTFERAIGKQLQGDMVRFASMADELEFNAAKFDLQLDMLEGQDGVLQVKFTYNTDLFAPSTVTRFAEQYVHVLHMFAASLTLPIAEQNWLSAGDRDVLAQMNDTAVEYDLDQLLLDAFVAQAEAHPSRIALSYEGQTMTYGELHARSNQVAHFLRAQGVQRNQLVGILMERGLEMMVGLYGIVKSGAAYVPIDPEYPANRVQYMLSNSGAEVLITKRAYQAQVVELSRELAGLHSVLVLDEGEAQGVHEAQETHETGLSFYSRTDLQTFSSDTPARINEPTDIAYMIYTSGSTGNPKGATISHRAIINRLLWHQDTFQATPTDVVAQRTSVCFDVSVWELFWATRHGAKLSILPTEVVKDPYRMHAHLVRENVSVMHFVPSLFSLFVYGLQNMEPDERHLPALRWVITSGEALPDKSVQLWFELFENAPSIANLYGPTEAAVDVTSYLITEKPTRSILIGKPIANTQLYVLDEQGRPCPLLVKGELHIGGVQLAEGYYNNPEKTAEAFIPNHLPGTPGTRLYKTGDLARVLPDGNIEYLGRKDSQVKVRGYRIELGEIENTLLQHPDVEQAAVLARKGADGLNTLVAFYTTGRSELTVQELKAFLADKMPEYMVPPTFHLLDTMPLSPNGKVDRKSLAEVHVQAKAQVRSYEAPVNVVQERIIEIWSRVLERDGISIHDNFFDLGGHSLLVVKVYDALKKELQVDIPMTDLFKYPTVKLLADAIAKPEQESLATRPIASYKRDAEDTDIAIIGIGLRMPEANDPYEFWENLRNGRESISFFSEDEMDPAPFNQDPATRDKVVRAAGVLEDHDLFDAEFFGISEREAKLMDPQHRIFLECAWDAMQNAGYRPDMMTEEVSLFAGSGHSGYLQPGMASVSSGDFYQAYLASQPRFLATRVSYKLNLTGESMLIDTACSTSLVAVHMACQSLLSGSASYALAGGVNIAVQQKTGYVYEPGFILSPDGHCRAFDKDAQGTVSGNGAGVIFMKRLSDAKRDGDPIYAVIKGSAVNNDGNVKVGYTAPGLQGQVDVIRKAQQAAGVSADTITYIEAHGTGTPMGDPIEVSALQQVFHEQTDQKQFCALGSVKTNIGHLDAAAGIAGLIKTVLALKFGELPPSLHYKEANPAIDFANSPFYVNHTLQPWNVEGKPRRAGVSSFGIGGTNAHVILEEAPRDAR